MKILRRILSIFALLAIFTGCQTDSREQILFADKSQVALRSIQSRVFDTADQALTMRTIIATLQDLGFTVDKVDQDVGVVSATKVGNYLLKITVSSRQRGSSQTVVRASAQYNLTAVSDPELYQSFFNSLQQSIFLEAHKIN